MNAQLQHKPVVDLRPDDKATPNIALQTGAAFIWDRKYRLKDPLGNPVDADIDASFERIAWALAEVEKNDWEKHYRNFLWALNHGAIPAGRIIANAGAEKYKPSTSTINCVVSATIRDSMYDILEKNRDAGLTLKKGSGIGYEFSTIRPKGAFVRGAGAATSGPLSFMDIYDKTCSTIASAGNRRGAQMATFDIRHPDIETFIQAKREDGRLRNFNLSCLINDEFIQAVKKDKDWQLSFPAFAHEVADESVEIVYRDWPYQEDYFHCDEQGRVACKVYKTVRAKHLWDMIMRSNYDFAEPGFILIDRVNRMNNNWFCEDIRASNPCGEQFLPPNGSCLLGSVDLTKFVRNPFSDDAWFDFAEYKKVIRVFTRMLDNVVEINGLPLQGQRDELLRKRRHGMGFFGLGSALAMMTITYGSSKSVQFTETVSKLLAITGYEEGLKLAKEKGPAPIMEEEFEITPAMMRKRPELASDGIQPGAKVKGKVLWSRYSEYLAQMPKALLRQLEETGCRFTHHSSIAPTGTIALSLGNNCSNGIEPSFAHAYTRNVIVAGKKSKESIPVYSLEYLTYRFLHPDVEVEQLPDYFVQADSVTPQQHVDIQAAAQQWMDSSISKTINVPTDIAYQDFEQIYLYACQQDLKGCTTFRFNPEAFQGVLVKETDLANTVYVFSLEDGTEIEAKGNEQIFYDGEEHSAANLFDAIKEGSYGKH